MDINNKARIHWACRRGMRELDISIMPFFEHEYDSLSDDEKRIFIRLLECDDPDLFNWLMNHGKPADAELEMMVRLIQTRNRKVVLWQSDLRVSWRAQWLSLLIHGLVAAVILSCPGRSVTPRYGWCYFRWWCLIAFAASGVLMLARGKFAC